MRGRRLFVGFAAVAFVWASVVVLGSTAAPRWAAQSATGAWEPSPVTIFGPEAFARQTGKPVTETRQVRRGWDEAPFYIHLTNGLPDGSKRCSSAEVSLDGRSVFGPSDFSQRVDSRTAAVVVSDESKLEITLNSAPGCEITVTIEGMPPVRTVGPEGGVLEFPGENVLTVPAGAVAEETKIALQPLSCADGNVIIAAQDGLRPLRWRSLLGNPHGFTPFHRLAGA